jgi:DNA-binding response OmpR family regulator
MSGNGHGVDPSSSLILVVDDDEDIRDLFNFVLSGAGFQVISTFDGHGALAVIEQRHPNLVLLDVMLPDLSGLEVLQRIRENHDELVRQMPVLMVTARSEKPLLGNGPESAFTKYLLKPFTPAVLLRQVTAVVARSRRHAN